MDRRDLLKLGLAGAGFAALGGCSQLAANYSGRMTRRCPFHLAMSGPKCAF